MWSVDAGFGPLRQNVHGKSLSCQIVMNWLYFEKVRIAFCLVFRMQRSYSDVMLQTGRGRTTPPKKEWAQRFTSFRQKSGGRGARDQVGWQPFVKNMSSLSLQFPCQFSFLSLSLSVTLTRQSVLIDRKSWLN